MKLFKQILIYSLIVCLLFSFSACASTESSQYPAHYTALCDMIGKPLDAALAVLKASDSGVTPDKFGVCYVPVEIEYQGVSFDTVSLGFYEDALFSFYYGTVFEADSSNKAAGTSAVAMQLLQWLGKPMEERTLEIDKEKGLSNDPSYEEVFSVEYLTEWFSEKSNGGIGYNWDVVVDCDLTTESAKALYEAMLKDAKYEKEKYRENLKMQAFLGIQRDQNGAASLKFGFWTLLDYGNN